MDVVWYLVAAAAVWLIGMALTAAATLGGLPFVILAAVFTGLKLGGIISWSWCWTLLPLWGAVGGAVVRMYITTRDPMWRYR